MPATDLSVTGLRVVGRFVETVAGEAVTFDKLERGKTYFHPNASHRQRFALEIGGREYWGELVRTRTAAGYVCECDLNTRNTRTRHGLRVREGAMAGLRAALIKAFRAHIESYVAEVEATIS